MVDYVLTCRIYFNDQGNADNAFNHIKALAEHSAAHDRHVGNIPDTSWARLHECFVQEDEGDTSRCSTTQLFTLNEEAPGNGGDVIEWAPNQTVVVDDERSWEEQVYKCLQDHTTQEGWEPTNAPALWQLVN